MPVPASTRYAVSFATIAVAGPERAGSGSGVPVPSITTSVFSDPGLWARPQCTTLPAAKYSVPMSRPWEARPFSLHSISQSKSVQDPPDVTSTPGKSANRKLAHPRPTLALPEMAIPCTIDRFRRNVFVLMIRLSRIGKKKKPFYRVVVIEKTRPRDGRVVDAVGTYDPLKKPAEIKLDADRVKHWLGKGAQPSDTVRSFIKLQKIA